MYNSNSAREIESFHCLMLNVHKKASLLSTFIKCNLTTRRSNPWHVVIL